MQSHRLLLAASAVICSFGLAMNSAEASISHMHTTHMSPHVSRSVAHTTPHVRATHPSPRVHYSPKHSRPVNSTPTPKAAGRRLSR